MALLNGAAVTCGSGSGCHTCVVEADEERLGGDPADLLLSDAAPKLTGIRDRDRAQEEELLLAIESCLTPLLRPGGSLLVKILEGPEAQVIDKRIRRRFDSAKTVKPKATRRGSTERYLFAKGYKVPSPPTP